MANHTDKLAIVWSLHLNVGGHGGALFRSITGQKAPEGKAKDRKNWLSLTAMLSRFRDAQRRRAHCPVVYSQVLAGGGIRGGQVYDSSDANGAHPASDICQGV